VIWGSDQSREKWHDDGGRDINNPKIPIKFVKRVGKLVYKTGRTVAEIADEAAKARKEVKKPWRRF